MLKLISSLTLAALVAAPMSTQAEETKETKRAKRSASRISSNTVIGSNVNDASGEAIADVNTIILDREGNVHYLVVGVGGLAGVGETEVAVPCKAVKARCMMEDDEKVCKLTLPMSAEQLERAPELEGDQYAELTDKNWRERNAKFFNSDATELTKNNMLLVSQLTNLDVTGSNNEEIGVLDALILNQESRKAEFAIIGYGGTLGVAKSYTAVPFKALKIVRTTEGELQASLNATEKTLQAAPKVTPSNYAELDREVNRNSIHEAFGDADE
ncbi:PRC-barrel domain-containing protein [Thalassoroseus pseudoceratinae]|uniref:PRC-barrel domain-containing protein n=1 Tax=Thalassoroseus pseudoceratinae TaxID=2713176 RepID=UPI00141FE5F4|nr:PRC-barrel domain-containing protein [Thalassoroseus pseudoceratinae]